MKIYERFMDEVREANQDEFQELNDIVSRYKQLKQKANELEQKQKEYVNETEKYNQMLVDKEKMAKVEQLRRNNNMAKQQSEIEAIDNEKGKLLNARDENNAKMSDNTKRAGQLLMTIENLYSLCTEKYDLIKPSSYADQEDSHKMPLRSYEAGDENDQTAKEQKFAKNKAGISKICAKHLEIVHHCFKNMKKVEEKFVQLKSEQADGKNVSIMDDDDM